MRQTSGFIEDVMQFNESAGRLAPDWDCELPS